MNNILFVMLVFTAMVLLIIFVSLSKNASRPYNNNIFGVTLPSDRIESNEVKQAIQYYKKDVRIWMILMIIFFLPELLINLFFRGYPSVCFVYFFLWLFVMLLSCNKPFIEANKKLNNIKKNKWHIGQGSIINDNDDKWIHGFIYCNPNDNSTFVEKRIGIGYTANLAKTKGKIFFYGMITFATVIIITLSLFFLFSDFYNPTIKINNNNIVISDLTNSIDFEIKDIKEIDLLNSIPNMTKINGSETQAFARGKFNISDYGKTEAYIFKGGSKYIIMKLSNSYVIYNENTDEKTIYIYNLLKKSISTSK